MGLVRKAFSVSTSLGLIGFRSKSEQEARNFRLAAEAAQRQTAGLLRRQNELIEQQTAAILRQQETLVPQPVVARVVPPVAPVSDVEKRDLAQARKAHSATVRAELAERARLREEQGFMDVSLGGLMEPSGIGLTT